MRKWPIEKGEEENEYGDNGVEVREGFKGVMREWGIGESGVNIYKSVGEGEGEEEGEW